MYFLVSSWKRAGRKRELMSIKEVLELEMMDLGFYEEGKEETVFKEIISEGLNPPEKGK